MKDCGTTGSGAWHVKGCSLTYSHKEYPGAYALSSDRVELLYTLRCLSTIRLSGWTGKVHHRLDNEGVLKKCRHISHDMKTETTAAADLWVAMCTYLEEWKGETTISWVKGRAEKGGAKTNDHETQNKKADENAEEAYGHSESPLYRIGYCSQFDTIRGAMIDGKVVAHKTGASVLRYLQSTQYLRYWKTRRGAGAWAENADIDGHAAACRRARKGNPRGPSCALYKEMNSRYPTFDIQHQKNHRYDPSTLETETCWYREVIDQWVAVCPDTIAEKVREALSGANKKCIGERLAGTLPIDSKTVQNLALRLGAQQPDVQWEHIEVSIRYWRSKAHLGERLNCPPLQGAGHKRPLQALLCGAGGCRRETKAPRPADCGDLHM